MSVCWYFAYERKDLGEMAAGGQRKVFLFVLVWFCLVPSGLSLRDSTFCQQ